MLLTIAVSYLLSPDSNNEFPIVKQIKNLKKYIPSESSYLIEILYIIQYLDVKEFERAKEKLDKYDFSLKIKFIYGGEKGVAKSRNLAIRESNSSYLLFFDIDCKFNREISCFLDFLNSKKTKANYIFFSKNINYRSKSLSLLP